MQLYLLHLDDALDLQPDFIRVCETHHAQHIRAYEEGSNIRLWGETSDLSDLHHKLKGQLAHNSGKPKLCFMGSGDFHHVASSLLSITADMEGKPITVIHFDNHPDWVHFQGGVHCGSWVNKAVEHPFIEKIITVGVNSRDLRLPEWKGANLKLLSQKKLELYPYNHPPSHVKKDYGSNICFERIGNNLCWKTMVKMGEQNFIRHLLTRINTEDVYLTIDKDILAREDAITNWDQGQMRLPYLIDLIRSIGMHHHIIGADVTGDYSIPSYTGSLWTRFKKHAEIFMDQPHQKPSPNRTAKINSAANLALFEVLAEFMR